MSGAGLAMTALVVAPLCARAAATPDTVYVMPKIVVEARRIDPGRDLFERSGFVALLDLGPRKNRVEDLGDVLAQMVGVRVKSYGGLGSFATASIRGSSSSQVSVYLDGVPVGDPYLGVTNLADLPLGGVDRVEIYRGFSPAHLGASAIGGAVNLVTRDASGWRRQEWLSSLEVRESMGSFDTRRHQLSLWSAPHRRVRAFVHGGYGTGHGDFDFFDDNDTPVETGDDAWSVRRNNDHTAWNTLARVEADIARAGTASLSFDAFTREQGVPGRGAYQSLTARSQRKRRAWHGRFASAPFAGGRVRAWIDGFHSRSEDRFRDLDADVGLLAQDTDNTIRVYGGSARAEIEPPIVPVRLQGMWEERREEFHPVGHVPTTTEGPDRWRDVRAATISAELPLFDERLIFSAAERFESRTEEFFDAPRFPWLPPQPRGRFEDDSDSPSFGARWRATRWLTLKANAGRYYRVPTFLELFGTTGSVTGNAGLVPEQGTNRDVGVIVSTAHLWELHDLFLEISHLESDVENLILFFPNSQFTSRPSNIGSARIRGWEMTATGRIAAHLTFAAHYTRLDTKDTGPIPDYNGNELPSRPRDDLSASITGRRGWFALTYEYHYLGENYLNPTNFDVVPARRLHNLVLESRLPAGGLSLTLEARNITDNQVSDVAGFPLPGRSFYSTLSYRY